MGDAHTSNTTLLEELQQKVNTVQPGTGRATLDEVYDKAVHAAVARRCCILHCCMAIQVAKDAIFKNSDPKHLSAKMAQQLSYLGVLAMEVLRKEVTLLDVQLEGLWKDRAWKMVLMMSYCNPYMISDMTQEYNTMKWIRDVFCNHHDLCPSPRLRLEMIRFIMTWPNEVLTEPRFTMHVLNSLASLAPHITLYDMLPRGRPSLSGPLACLLSNLHDANVLGIFTASAFGQITRQNIGPEARFFSHLTRLMGEKAKALRYMCHNGTLDLLVVIEEYWHLLQTLNILVVSSSCKVAFRLPGLMQVGAIAIAATTLSLYKSSFKLVTKHRDSFKGLAAELGATFEILLQDNKTLMCELMSSQHRKSMTRAASLADQIGFPLHHMKLPPLEASDKGRKICPESFLDAVTGKIMEQPVQVLSCGSVVDISTLLGFLLFSNHRIPFALLAGLQRKINDWRMTFSSGVVHREFNGPIRRFISVMARYGAEWVQSPQV